MQQGEELRSLDLRLTDASALCFRGVWLTAKHRGQLKLPLPWAKNLAMMQRWGRLRGLFSHVLVMFSMFSSC